MLVFVLESKGIYTGNHIQNHTISASKSPVVSQMSLQPGDICTGFVTGQTLLTLFP